MQQDKKQVDKSNCRQVINYATYKDIGCYIWEVTFIEKKEYDSTKLVNDENYSDSSE